jgi:hypothetical protein
MFVIIEKMYRDVIPTQKIEQLTVGIHAAENVQCTDTIYGQIPGLGSRLPLFGHWLEFQRVIPAAHPSRIEQVIGLLHKY